MHPTTTTSSSPAIDPQHTLAGARSAVQLASSLAEVATRWAESARAGLEAARDARDAAFLAQLVVENAASPSSDDAIRLLAAEAWEAVHRALDATQRVTRAVSASYH